MTSADKKIDFTVSFEPVDGFWQFKSHFLVVFQGQLNGEVIIHIQLTWKKKSPYSDSVDGYLQCKSHFVLVFHCFQHNSEGTSITTDPVDRAWSS